MSKMQNNYFVCTLGQAAATNTKSKSYRTVSEFVEHQAQHHPNLPAVGFPLPNRHQADWGHQVLTFKDINQGTDVFAERLLDILDSHGGAGTIALLCHSSPEFLFTWLGLMRLGYSVLLVAPQCQPTAIVHLCTSCEASVLFYDTAHSERGHEVEELTKERGMACFKSCLVPLHQGEDIFRVIQEHTGTSFDTPKVDEAAAAYLHHTSGTSSGLPTPIPQSHRAAIGVLPHLPKIPAMASFTTTPLYHGGIADLFRCWTSNALIWLFPGRDMPITARNICNCLHVAESYSETEGLPKVKYFSSVPYVLQMMEADIKGLECLRKMAIVGVGGAALPAEVGDRLVAHGVNLISRFGSAECGFILSSYRDFTADKAWQYLRNYNPPKLLAFEERDGNLAELVIKPGWPHMAKKNRSDGSFATADLFAPHATIKNAWLYHSRADSQLTLITGKKFDPAPLEDAIATSPHLDDVLIFGNNRPFPGALLLRSEQSSAMIDQDIIDAMKPVVARMNRESQDHARIPFNMLVPVPHQSIPLEKSSKGTIIRRAAETRFEEIIEGAYNSQETDQPGIVRDEDLPQYLVQLVQLITSQSMELTKDDDLFSYGVDSIACMQLRSRLRQLIPDCTDPLPMNVVEDCGSIQRLTDFVLQKRHGESDTGEEDEEQLMINLVGQFGSFEKPASQAQTNDLRSERKTKDVVVLTGATGALGAHVLDLLQKTVSVETIYCLTRGADEFAAKDRVNQALEQRGLASLLSLNKSNHKVKVVKAQLDQKRLGLDGELYDYLAKEATLIIHIAWTVNFRLKLRSFVKDNIAGVRNLLDLALKARRAKPPRFVYCSSTAAIMDCPLDESGELGEKLSSDPSSASPLGYSRSKWVAEHICLEAHTRTSLHGRVSVVRVGQLAGDSISGVWNTKEAWPMMLSTARLIKCLPDLRDEPLDWLPVDVAAQAFIETTGANVGDGKEMFVHHVLNPHQKPTWHEMLKWLQKKEDFEIVPPDEWVRRLEDAGDNGHSAMKLLGLWKDSYSKGLRKSKPRPPFSMVETKKYVPTLRDVKPLDEGYVGRMWDWVQKSVQ